MSPITKRWQRLGTGLSYRKQILLFLIPYLGGSLILLALPALTTVGTAFTEYNAIGKPTWAGLDNFRQLIESPLVRLSLRNTTIFLLLAVPLRLGGALVLALLLQRRQKAFGLYRIAAYLPTVVPEAAYALIWLWVLNPVYGPLNMVLTSLRLPAPAWLTEPATARLGIILMASFQIGEGMVVLLTGLQSIPHSLYDSATVDGASSWQCFTKITLPLITPWLLLLTFRDMLVSLQNTFTPSFMMTYGGPYYATTFVPLLVYELSFDFNELGLAAAVLLVTYALIGALVMGILNIVEGAKGHV